MMMGADPNTYHADASLFVKPVFPVNERKRNKRNRTDSTEKHLSPKKNRTLKNTFDFQSSCDAVNYNGKSNNDGKNNNVSNNTNNGNSDNSNSEGKKTNMDTFTDNSNDENNQNKNNKRFKTNNNFENNQEKTNVDKYKKPSLGDAKYDINSKYHNSTGVDYQNQYNNMYNHGHNPSIN
eukprot:Pgem_evm1s1365